jgi:hypothetical protein
LLAALPAQPVSVSTGNYDNARTGANTSETTLTQASVVNLTKKGTYSVDGPMLSQPLVIDGVSIGGASRVLIIATMANTIYAFNADSPGSAALWSTNVGTPVTNTDADLYSESLGCIATPVVDTSAAVVYAACLNVANGWRLYALNLADGTNFHAAVTISGSNNGHTFDGDIHLARPALTLANGNVYVAFGSYFDLGTYFGWVFAYNATTLASVAVWADVASGGDKGGIWMSGGGIAVDSSGNLFVTTGNGTCNSGSDANYGNAIVKLSSTLSVLDWMQPSNCSTLNVSDLDLGTVRAILIGDTPVMGGGKDGRWWVVNPASMGHVNSGSPSFTAAGAVFNGAVYANSRLYLGPAFGSTARKIYRFDWNGSTFSANGNSSATTAFPGASQLAYSSNGATAGTAIIWAVTCASSADSTLAAGTLRAFNADTLSELYNSGTVGGDALGNIAKFLPPTVANGMVFVATQSDTVVAYGLPQSPTTPTSLMRGVTTRNVRIR